VRVVAGGVVEHVTPARAARLLVSRQAELPEDVSIAEARAILAVHAECEERTAEALRRDGLLLCGDSGRPAPMPDRFQQGELGAAGRLALARGDL
jgi:hypothetical protein